MEAAAEEPAVVRLHSQIRYLRCCIYMGSMEAAEGYVDLVRCTRAFGPNFKGYKSLGSLVWDENAAEPENMV